MENITKTVKLFILWNSLFLNGFLLHFLHVHLDMVFDYANLINLLKLNP